MFDRIIAIDWSGASTEDARVDLRIAAWDSASGRCRVESPPGSASRSWRRSECRASLAEVLAQAQRTLVAMDFCLGLPWGADEAIFRVRGWREMIRQIGRIYSEAGTARAAAHAINALPHLGGHGPYRFNENRTDFRFYINQGVGYYRLTEQAAPQAISPWYLGSGGTVGFHTITGLAAIDYLVGLREGGRIDFAVWPFEPARPDQHILAEVYPAMCPRCPDRSPCRDGNERDAWRVLQHLLEANRSSEISEWFTLPPHRFGRIANISFEDQLRFEGAILGLR